MSDLLAIDPNLAFFLVIVGALAMLWESHVPGLVLPGVLGALLVGAGAFSLYEYTPTWYGVAMLTGAALLLFVELKYYTHMVSGIAGSILLACGGVLLLQGSQRVTPSVAVAASLAIGSITIFLGFLGMRARSENYKTGTEALVGALGVTKTALDPEGSVFVNGEYWRARGAHAIPPGHSVFVESIQDFKLFVREAL